MALNPMALLKIKERLSIFHQDHPKVAPFFHMLGERALVEGAVYELKVTTPSGEEHTANIRLTENDIETIRILFKKSREGF